MDTTLEQRLDVLLFCMQWPWMSADAAQQAAGTAQSSAHFAWYSLHAWCSFWVRGAGCLVRRLLPRRWQAQKQA